MHMAEPLHFAPGSLRGALTEREPMAKHVTWRAGGAARHAYVPADREDLATFLATLPAAEPVLFVGLGSNLLVRDGGFAGTVVLMHHTRGDLRLEGGLVYADAGMASPKVARFAATHGCEGAEFLAGVPGTVGGALAMNAGCYGSETWHHVERVATIDRSGTVRMRTPADYMIGYRTCIPRAAADEAGPAVDGAPDRDDRENGRRPAASSSREEWFVGAWLRFASGDPVRARARITELLQKRVATQPLNQPNAGSVFRNPPGDHAARLIEACGLKGLAIGGARISEKHANFIVNPGRDASAADIEALIAAAQAEVHARFGIALHPEVRIVGEAQ
jgi:UDP-N-acetylmuramate dehydrogenase